MMPAPGIYVGRVVHRRLRPEAHALSYRAYWLLIELPGAAGREAARELPRLLSFDRFNLFSVMSRDHGEGGGGSLRALIQGYLARAGVTPDPGGRIFLLTMPRILGYVFNPLSIYFCYRGDGTLVGMVYEVHNTFGQRHSYVIPVDPGRTAGAPLRQTCEKRFYVSPFLPMGLTYDFVVSEPGADLAVAVTARDGQGPVIATSLSAQRRPLRSPSLLRVFLSHPLIALKVIGAIHWEALRIWLKGIRIVERPPPPSAPISVAGSASQRGGGDVA
ncbi:MAG: DUF1365 domain-containing protein [Hyphomicrobiaceae bacterium]|nr:DUF1365 domain-containing protein [Hyphomicrobiaceae bacterium]